MYKNNHNKLNNAARFKHKVEIQKAESYQTNEGYWIEDELITFAKSFAQIRTIRGNEFILAGAHRVEVSARINIRYNKFIANSDSPLKVRFNNRLYDVVYINNLEEKNIELELIVNEIRE